MGTNALNYLIKSFSGPSAIAYIVASFLGLPGVNAASGVVLRPVMMERAVREGFGKGEVSGMVNNIRAIISGLAPVVYGNLYASGKDKMPAISFLVAAILSAL